MNFYKHHIGDYDQATRHLSFAEDAAYSRLIRKYYAEEKPLPADIARLERLVGASTPEERAAIAAMLAEFFTLEADGWHNKRCDEELDRANAVAESNRVVAQRREERRRRLKLGPDDTLLEPALEAGPAVKAAEADGRNNEHDSFTTVRETREPSQTPDTTSQTPDSKPTPLSVALVVRSPGGEGEETAAGNSTPLAGGLGLEGEAERQGAGPAASAKTERHVPPASAAPGMACMPQAPAMTPKALLTRKGALCKVLRKRNFDAAPHYAAWGELLAHTDTEILGAAALARDKKPHERLHLNYLLPMLRDPAVSGALRSGQASRPGAAHASTRHTAAAVVSAFVRSNEANQRVESEGASPAAFAARSSRPERFAGETHSPATIEGSVVARCDG